MRYALALLTHGAAPTLGWCLWSFAEQVTPSPSRRLALIDGPGRMPPAEPLGAFEVHAQARRAGFCTASGLLWQLAAASEEPYVFWLEHDFVFDRRVDLAAAARLLDARPELVQVQLMRDAVSDEEKAAGGLFEARRGDYHPHVEEDGTAWLEHHGYYTTNPSLMRTSFLTDEPWPGDRLRCEGLFGLRLIRAGRSFAVLGEGEPWMRHVGVRDGSGFGY